MTCCDLGIDTAGAFFPDWQANTGKYVMRCSDKVKAWFKSLRSNGRKVFLLSSSYVDYVKASMTFVFGYIFVLH